MPSRYSGTRPASHAPEPRMATHHDDEAVEGSVIGVRNRPWSRLKRWTSPPPQPTSRSPASADVGTCHEMENRRIEPTHQSGVNHRLRPRARDALAASPPPPEMPRTLRTYRFIRVSTTDGGLARTRVSPSSSFRPFGSSRGRVKTPQNLGPSTAKGPRAFGGGGRGGVPRAKSEQIVGRQRRTLHPVSVHGRASRTFGPWTLLPSARARVR